MRGIKYKKENKIKRVLLFLFFAVVFVLLLGSIFRVYEKRRNAELALIEMQNELALLEEREKSLISSLGRLETEEGMKFELRSKLNVALQGEGVAIIVDEKSIKEEIKTPPKTFWQKVKEFFNQF